MHVDKVVTAVRVLKTAAKRRTPSENDITLLRSWVGPHQQHLALQELAWLMINAEIPPVKLWPGKQYLGVFRKTA